MCVRNVAPCLKRQTTPCALPAARLVNQLVPLEHVRIDKLFAALVALVLRRLLPMDALRAAPGSSSSCNSFRTRRTKTSSTHAYLPYSSDQNPNSSCQNKRGVRTFPSTPLRKAGNPWHMQARKGTLRVGTNFAEGVLVACALGLLSRTRRVRGTCFFDPLWTAASDRLSASHRGTRVRRKRTSARQTATASWRRVSLPSFLMATIILAGFLLAHVHARVRLHLRKFTSICMAIASGVERTVQCAEGDWRVECRDEQRHPLQLLRRVVRWPVRDRICRIPGRLRVSAGRCRLSIHCLHSVPARLPRAILKTRFC